MSAHPAPSATRSIRAETAGSSGLALDPNQSGKAGGEVEASIPFMDMAPSALDEGSAGELGPILPRRYDGRHPAALSARLITSGWLRKKHRESCGEGGINWQTAGPLEKAAAVRLLECCTQPFMAYMTLSKRALRRA